MPKLHRLRPFIGLLLVAAGLLTPNLMLAKVLLALSAFLFISHLLFQMVWLAYKHTKKGAFDKAEKMLQWSNLNLLLPFHRPYYQFVKSMIAIRKEEVAVAKQALLESLKPSLPKKDQAIALMHLATLAIQEQQFPEAQSYLAQVKSISLNDLVLKEQIAVLEKRLSQ